MNRIDATLEKITAIMLEMAHRQDAHDGALIETNKTIDRLAAHIDALDLRMESMFVAITQTNAAVNHMDERLGARIDALAAKIDTLVEVVAKHEARLARLEGH